jgi:hypothetical protein
MLKIQDTDLRHVARSQIEAGLAIKVPLGIGMPGVVLNVQGAEKFLLRKVRGALLDRSNTASNKPT